MAASLVVSLVAVGVSWGALGVGYFADDFTVLTAVAGGAGEVDWLGAYPAGTGSYFRPLTLATLLVGDGPLVHHAVHLALHAVCGLLLLALCGGLLGWRTLGAAALALVFMLHPLVVPNVYWIAARAELLVSLLFLAGCVGFLGFLRGGSRALLGVAGGGLLLAPLAKEVGILLIVALAALWLAARQGLLPGARVDRERRAAAGRFLLLGALAVAALAAVVGSRFWVRGGIPWGAGPAGPLGVLLVAVNGLVLRIDEYDLRRWALAVPWLKWLAVAVGAAVAAGVAGAATRFDGRRGLLRLVLLGALPLLPLVPLMALGWARERHLYLPLALAVVALAAGLRHERPRRAAAWTTLALLPLLAWRASAAGEVWQANARFLEASCAGFREALDGTAPDAPIVLPTVPFSRAEVPLYSNDAPRALHHCLHGTFGRLERLHVLSGLALRSPAADPWGALHTTTEAGGAVTLRVDEEAGYLRLIPDRRPGPARGDEVARVTVVARNPAGQVTGIRVEVGPGRSPLVLGLGPKGFRRLEGGGS